MSFHGLRITVVGRSIPDGLNGRKRAFRQFATVRTSPCHVLPKRPSANRRCGRPVSALRRLVLQFPDPDIAETDRVQVVLQHDRAATVGDRFREADEFRRAEDQRVVLDQHAVVQHGDPSVRVQRTVVLEPGRRVDDVVGVPFARFLAGVDQRGRLQISFTSRVSIEMK